MFKNQSLQRRIITAFLFMGALVLIVALIGWSGNSRLSKDIGDINGNFFPSVVNLWKVKDGQSHVRSSERLLLNPIVSSLSKQDELTKLDDALKQIQDGFQSYEKLPRDPDEDKIYQTLLPLWRDWENAHNSFMSRYQEYEISSSNRKADLLNRLEQYRSGTVVPAFDKSEKALLDLLDYNQKGGDEAGNRSTQDISQSNFWILVGLVIGPLTAVLFGIYFSNTIAKPLGARIAGVVDAAQKISAGDLTAQVQPGEQQDEIGRLLNAFHIMNKDLNALIRQIQKSGIQITTSATQIAAAGKELEATVAEQLASTNEVTATAHQIAATSRGLVKTMDQVAELSQATAVAAGSSQENLNHMEGVMRQLSTATQAIAAKLGVMSEKANNINSVVTTINKVADQTNLLSLNAAIEAEKAGEYGAGFAVVAREIRRLADQTAVATLEIAQMIKEMQSSVSTGVMEVDRFNKSVVDTVADVNRVSDQIAEVIHQVQGLTPRFEQVSQAVEEQSQGAQQISEAMEQLSQASQQTVDSLQETNRALEELDKAAHGLRTETTRFRTA